MRYDLIVIGGGPGGYAAAVYAAKHSMKVALVEKDRLGGTCLQRGCVPTKAYLHTAETAEKVSRFFSGSAMTPVDRRAMLQHKDEIVQQLTDGLHMLIKANRVDLYTGQARLTSMVAPFSVHILPSTPTAGNELNGPSVNEERELEAPFVLLAAGCKPVRLPVPGCDDPGIWTSDDILGEAGAENFNSLFVVGGGVIGTEMACIYARLGVSVVVLEAEKSCLPFMDRELSRATETLLKGMGVRVVTNARLNSAKRQGAEYVLSVARGDDTLCFMSDRVLLATGRRPVTEGLFGKDVAIRLENGWIAANNHFETSISGVYAIGDINGQIQLAHAAHAQGLAAVSYMLGISPSVNTQIVPSCVYTSPEIASVGLTQGEAKARGMEVLTGKALTTQNARTLIEGLGRGFIKLVFDKQTLKLLGAQLFCGRATDIVGELTLAISQGLTAHALIEPMRAHPTFYEAVTEAVEAALR